MADEGYAPKDTFVNATTGGWTPVTSPSYRTRGYLIHVQADGASFKISNNPDGTDPTTIPPSKGGRGRAMIIPEDTVVEYVQSIGSDQTLAVAWVRD